jgi:hypothetical protein
MDGNVVARMAAFLLCLAVAGCGGSGPTVTNPPTPAPTPQIALISASPTPGSSVSAGRNEPLTLRLRVTSPTAFRPRWLCADYLSAGESSAGACGQIGCPGNCIGQAAPIPPDTPQEFVISMGAGTSARACGYPRVTERVRVCFTEETGLELRLPDLPARYTINP